MRWSPITAFAERDPDCGEILKLWRQRSLAMGSIWMTPPSQAHRRSKQGSLIRCPEVRSRWCRPLVCQAGAAVIGSLGSKACWIRLIRGWLKERRLRTAPASERLGDVDGVLALEQGEAERTTGSAHDGAGELGRLWER